MSSKSRYSSKKRQKEIDKKRKAKVKRDKKQSKDYAVENTDNLEKNHYKE